MKVRYTFEYDEDFAIALGTMYGQGRQTRDDVRTWIMTLVEATADDVRADHNNEQKEGCQ